MSDRTVPSPRERTAHACEPCRRKKAKCPGQRPACSYCTRLGQICHYKDSKGQLRSVKRRRLASPTRDHASQNDSSREVGGSRLESNVDIILAKLDKFDGVVAARNFVDRFELRARADQEQLNAMAVAVYLEKFHGQPLLLFPPTELASQMREWPRYLSDAFFALAGVDSEAIGEKYVLIRRIRRQIMLESAESQATEELIAALCILAVLDIGQSDTNSACVHIGMAERMCEILLGSSPASRYLNQDLCGCIWTATYLNQTSFLGSPVSSALHQDARIFDGLPDGRPSTTQRDGVEATRVGRDSSSSQHTIYKEVSVLLNVWTLANTLAQDVKAGTAGSLWQANSSYHRVQQALFDFEADHSPCHRLENCGFESCAQEQIMQHRSYLLAWFTQQLLYHTSHLLMHHPLLHTSPSSSSSGVQVPPSFRQHAIDQTLLHAKWVVRLVGKSREKSLEPNDPFLAYLVGVTASALLFFSHTSNERICAVATQGFEKCLDFINSFSQRWPHVRHMTYRLRIVREGSLDRSSSRPTARSSLLWDLLVYTSSIRPVVNEGPSAQIELMTTTEHLAAVDRETESYEAIDSSDQAHHTTAGLQSILNDFVFLDSFDAALPASIFDGAWYDFDWP